MILSLSSCGSVFDDLDACPAGVEMRFVYSHNLDDANAFPSQMHCLNLYIYDEEGAYVSGASLTGTHLADENWRHALKLAPGRYHAIAYGGIDCEKASFDFDAVPEENSRFTDISMRLKDDHIGSLLHDHFHGALDFTVEEGRPELQKVTLYMKKTTNSFRILLRQLNGQPLDGNDFEFYITDDNRCLDHENTPVLSGEYKDYSYWTRGSAEDMAYGEISTSRLHLSTQPRLRVVSSVKNDTIIDMPLNKYLLMTKSESTGWSDQEYLDRCSQWNMTFFLDDDRNWLNTRIVINGWTVRINNLDS